MFFSKKKKVSIEQRGNVPVLSAAQKNYLPKPYTQTRGLVVNGVFGETDIGKSYQMDIEVGAYIKAIPGVRNARRVLIGDTNGEYPKYPEVALKSINSYGIEARRVNMRGWSVPEKKAAMIFMAEKFQNGHLIIDDIDKFAVFSRDQELIGTLMGNRHQSVDLTLCHQSLAKASPTFYENVTTLRLHHQQCRDQVLREKASGYFTILKIAQNIIKTQYELGNNRFYLTLNLRTKKIKGCSSQKAYRHACQLYLALYKDGLREERALLSIANMKVKDVEALAVERALKKLEQYWVPYS